MSTNSINIIPLKGLGHNPVLIIRLKNKYVPLSIAIIINYYTNYYGINYSEIVETTPEPTVLPPSLIANLNPSSIATGFINSTAISI
jgi:hypothetical protein